MTEVFEANNAPQEEKRDTIEVEQPEDPEVIIEGLLYIVGDDGVKAEQLAQAVDKPLEDVQAMLESIRMKYAGSAFGIELVDYGSSYKFVSKKAVFPYAQELFHTAKANTLSQSALETLAIIAYKQPVTRQEIADIRGISSDYAVNRLVEYGLIEECGRQDAPGRAILFGTTEQFLRSFGVRSLDELPSINTVKAEEFREEAEKEIDERLGI